LYPGTEVNITNKDINELVCFGPTAEVYELAQPLGQGKLETALPILMDLLERTAIMPLLYALGTYFRRLLRIKAVIESAKSWVSDEELVTATENSLYNVQQARPQADRWSMAKLRKVSLILEETQRTIVTSPLPPELVFQAMVIKIGCLARDI
jgi:DNA polymerase III delta subunit